MCLEGKISGIAYLALNAKTFINKSHLNEFGRIGLI